MIKYTLRCSDDHRFESWFASAEAYESLAAAGRLSCAVCGDGVVEKAMMAPRVRPGRNAAGAPMPVSAPDPGSEAPPERIVAGPPQVPPEVARALRALRRRIERESDYVGPRFAAEARAIHTGDAPERLIHGEASGAEVRDLLDDGVPVAPLPFSSPRKVN